MSTTTTHHLDIAAYSESLIKVFGRDDTQVVALDGVSVDFYKGVYTAIMGPSGSGKSTLMHCMAALDNATSGRVVIGDVEVTELSENALTRLRRERIGFVFPASNHDEGLRTT